MTELETNVQNELGALGVSVGWVGRIAQACLEEIGFLYEIPKEEILAAVDEWDEVEWWGEEPGISSVLDNLCDALFPGKRLSHEEDE